MKVDFRIIYFQINNIDSLIYHVLSTQLVILHIKLGLKE